jgi:hypothetical protein
MPDAALVAAVSGLAPLSDQEAADMLRMGVTEEVLRLASGGEQPSPAALAAAGKGEYSPCPSAPAGAQHATEYSQLGDGAWILLQGRELVLRDALGSATGRLLDFDVDARTLTFEVDGKEILIPLGAVVSVRRADGVAIVERTDRDVERAERSDRDLPPRVVAGSPALAATGRSMMVAGAVLGGIAIVGGVAYSVELEEGLRAAGEGDTAEASPHINAAAAWGWTWWISTAAGAPLLIAGAVTFSIGSQPAD